eukprot:7914979-Heterocapsa_arctica.AAC.1
MPKVWQRGVLCLPDLLVLPAEDPVPAPAAEAAAVGQQDEAAFRRLRATRALRIKAWMDSDLRQIWSAAALFVTEPLAVLL